MSELHKTSLSLLKVEKVKHLLLVTLKYLSKASSSYNFTKYVTRLLENYSY